MILVHEANFFQIRNRSSKCHKMDYLDHIVNSLVLANLSEPRKNCCFSQKVKIFAYCCHEKTLVIPQNEKRNFAKHGFTTEFSRRNTTFSTEIPTVLGVWTLYFQYFKKVWNFDFQNLFMQFTFTRKFQKAMFLRRFDPLFTTFWHNLVTEIHSSFPRSKTSFLKMRFLRLNFVILTPLNWLKY